MKKIGIFFASLCLLLVSKQSSGMEDPDIALKKLVIGAYNGNEEECRTNLALIPNPNNYLTQNIDAIDTGNVTYELNALSAAALTKHNDIINLLLSFQIENRTPINVNEASPTEGFTPLFMAIFGNNIDGLKLLLDKGAEVNTAAKNTLDTPLMKAASTTVIGDNPAFIQELLAKGAAPNTQNTNGDTALSFAILSKHNITAKELIAVTNLKLADKNGNTPLHQAASLGLDDIVKLLLEKGAELNAKNKADKTALELAEKRGKASTAQILMQATEQPAPPNTPRTPSSIEPELGKSLNSLHKSLTSLTTALSQ